MTRLLAEILEAKQPQFAMTIQDLERLAGHPKHDIRLTAEIIQQTNQKIRALGLDPQDTTAEELYQALQLRLQRDDGLLRQAIGLPLGASLDDVLRAVQRTAQLYADETKVYGLKLSTAKRILKTLPPKKTLKELHYRSLESLLKSEPVAAVLAAVRHYESAAWLKQLAQHYDRLTPADFETRTAQVLLLKGAKWERLAEDIATAERGNSLIVRELGAVIMLRPPETVKALTTTSLLLVIEDLNTIQSIGTYLKLHQVALDFKQAVRDAVSGEIFTDARFVSQEVPWRVIHQFYARHDQAYNPVIFEPHITSDDLSWRQPAETIAGIHQALDFWLGTDYLAFQSGGQQVSLNILDVALSSANQLPFSDRFSHVLRQRVWHELMLRYVSLEHVERTLTNKLTPQPSFSELAG